MKNIIRNYQSDAAASVNARKGVALAGYMALAKPPSSGDTVIVAEFPTYRPTMATVVSVRDHRPVDGCPTLRAIVDLHGGAWAYWWNLYEAD